MLFDVCSAFASDRKHVVASTYRCWVSLRHKTSGEGLLAQIPRVAPWTCAEVVPVIVGSAWHPLTEFIAT